MTEISLFYDAVVDSDGKYDREYSSKDFSLFFKNLYRSGIVMPVGHGLAIVPSATKGMRVVCRDGTANMEGYQYMNTSDYAITIDVASSSQDRVDSIVVRHDLGIRQSKIVYKKSSTEVERTDEVYELQLAQIKIPRNCTAITANLITDKRADSNLCGYATPYMNVPVSGLEAEYETMLKQLFETVQQYATEKQDDFEQEIKEILRRGNEQIASQQSIWDDFLKTLTDQLTDNQALNLQNQLLKLLPDKETWSISNLPFHYPEVTVTAWKNGFGINRLGDSNWLGDVPETIPVSVGYPSRNEVYVKVPLEWMLKEPLIEEKEPFNYLLVEGSKSLRIRLKENV